MPKKILLADDSITIQKVVELTFSDGDYEVTAVNNGAKAIARLSDMRPDIILSDIIMPEKNGYEVCEFVKSHPEYRNIPVVLLTGTFEPFDPDRADKAGCDAVVTKPFESQSLIHKVEELIEQSRAAASAPAAATPPPPPAPAASPWADEPPAAPAFTPASSFSPANLPPPPPPADPFAHDNDIFGAPATPAPAAEMPFATAPEMPFAAGSGFSGETRAFQKMSFDELQAGMTSSAPPPPPPVAPEASPWEEQPSNAFSGETPAPQTMGFGDLEKAPEASQEAAPPPAAEQPAADDMESPFGAPPPAEDFSGETRAFTKMSFDDLQKAAKEPEPAAPEPEPQPEPAAGSPWGEQPAFSGETRAFQKMSFDDLQNAAPLASPPAPAAPSSPWDEPAAKPADPWGTPAEAPGVPASFEAPASPASSMFDEQPAASPFAGEQEKEAAAPAAPAVEKIDEPAWSQAAPVAETQQASAFAATAAPAGNGVDLTDEQIDRIARRVVQLMSEQVVRNIAWEIIPDLAEMVVKERIRQLEAEA